MSEVTTVGNLLINDALPEDMRKHQHTLDKKGVHKLMMELAEKHPERYKEVLQGLSDVGKTTVWTEGLSLSLADLRHSKAKDRVLAPARAKIREIIDRDDLTHEERRQAIADVLIPISSELKEALMEEAREERNSFLPQIDSGARGNPGSFSSIRGADLLATDQQDRFIPLPLMHSYAEGYTPAEYFAASYGQRKGALDVKMATADAGFLNKQLVNAAHRQVVTHEEPRMARLPTGLPVDTSDRDNIGAVLAIDAGGYPSGTVIDDEILQDLQDQDVDEVVIFSPLTEISEDGGISALAAGRRQRQGLHQIGDNVGIPAAQAIGERLSQGALGSKHAAGVGDKATRAGFDYINRLIQSPETFPESGPLAEKDGIISQVEKAPQGGHYITVGEDRYYAPDGVNVTVKPGDKVEQGDDLTDGVPHPNQLVRLRGMGEARREYTRHLYEALKNSGVKPHRRNVESVVAGLLNWAKITNPDGYGDSIYDDVVPYGSLMANYQPRPTAQRLPPTKLRGKYLEEPVLHYTPGTRINQRMIDRLQRYGIEDVYAHDEEPDFEPMMVRGLLSVYHDPDWRTRLSGFYTARAFQKALHRGAVSDTHSTSFVPALGQATDFGKNLDTMGKYGSVTALMLGKGVTAR